MVNCHYIFATLVIIFGSSFQFGFQTGVVNIPLPLIENFITSVCTNRSGSPPSSFSPTVSSLVVAGFSIGGIFGALFGGSVSNKVGRKLSLFIFNIPMACGSLLMIICQAASSYEMIIIGRILVGFACGAFTGIAPVYLAEIAPVNIRGTSGVMHQLAIVSAILLSEVLGLNQVMGTDELWPYLLGATIIPSVVLLLLLWVCPDSPRYILLNRQDLEGARSALFWFRRKDELVDAEIVELMAEKEIEMEDHSKFTWKDFFFVKPLRLALFVSIVAHLAQQFSGINVAFSYSTLLFKSIGLTSEAVYITLGVGSMMVAVTVISVFLIERIGRRILLISGLSVMLGSAVTITIALALRSYASEFVLLAIIFIYIFVAGFAIGPGSIPWFVVAEIFVQKTRGPAIVITVIINWAAQIVASLIYPLLLDYLKDFSLTPFIVLLVIFIALLYFYLPETKGRTPLEMQEKFLHIAGGSENHTTTSLPNQNGDNPT